MIYHYHTCYSVEIILRISVYDMQIFIYTRQCPKLILGFKVRQLLLRGVI